MPQAFAELTHALSLALTHSELGQECSPYVCMMHVVLSATSHTQRDGDALMNPLKSTTARSAFTLITHSVRRLCNPSPSELRKGRVSWAERGPERDLKGYISSPPFSVSSLFPQQVSPQSTNSNVLAPKQAFHATTSPPIHNQPLLSIMKLTVAFVATATAVA